MAPLILTSHFRRISDLAGDLATAAPGEWPRVIFIEPEYHDCPLHFCDPCDNHSPLAITAGERFTAQVYNALASSPMWSRCVFIATYDEHGGFFDHVSPLPIAYRNENGVAFDSTGPRTPTIVAGPYAPKRGVSHAPLDNTSILQLLAERFAPGEPYSPEVDDRRRQGIASVSAVLDAAAGNTAMCRFGEAGVALGPTKVIDSQLRQGFDQTIRELAARHQQELLAKYPEIAGYIA